MVAAGKAGYLKSSDLVIGVAIEGQARAYPLRILNWHEVVNDSLGGTPIAVTYCPLCHSSFVFDRRVGGQVREFGVSGLLWNSNVLLYDRQPGGSGESLWSQLKMQAICGPAAKRGERLKLLPAELVAWKDWRTRHPDTTVLSERTGHQRNYQANPYARYFKTSKLLFPVSLPRRKRKAFKNKELMLVVEAGGKFKAYALKHLKAAADDEGVIVDEFAGRKIRLLYDKKRKTVRAEAGGEEEGAAPLATAYSFWFAWKSTHPEAEVYAPPR